MKKFSVLMLVVLMTSSPAYAGGDVVEGMKNKAVRGIVNIFTSVIEVPMQIYKGYNNGFEPIENKVGSKTVGTVLGVFRGFGHAAGRMTWGATELMGFWSVNHTDNSGVGIPFDAEYAWETGDQYSVFEPNFRVGIKPVEEKLYRGLSDGLLGIAELPGQTMKGASDGNIIKGLGKGVWYWFSREVYGLGSLISVIVPNAVDNPGHVTFDEERPWTVLSEQMHR